MQESRDTGEKIEHPWGRVNQLVYSPQHRSLQTFLGDFVGVDEFVSFSEGKLQINKQQNSSEGVKWGEVPANCQHINSNAGFIKGRNHIEISTQAQRT